MEVKLQKVNDCLKSELKLSSVSCNASKKKIYHDKIGITKSFLFDVLNAATMKKIRQYLQKHRSKYANLNSKMYRPYTIYQEFLLLENLKNCQLDIIHNDMFFYVSQVKNSSRSTQSIYKHLRVILKKFDQQNIIQFCKQKEEVKVKKNWKQLLNQIKSFVDQLMDEDVFQTVDHYIQSHELSECQSIKMNTSKTSKSKRFSLLQDCILLKITKQRILMQQTCHSLFKFIGRIVKRPISSIRDRFSYLKNTLDKENLILLVENDIRTCTNRNLRMSGEILDEINISIDELIEKHLKELPNTITNEHILCIERLTILLYTKRFVGTLPLKQIFQLLSAKMEKPRRYIETKYYTILRNFIRNKCKEQWLQKYLGTSQFYSQILQSSAQEINFGISICNIDKDILIDVYGENTHKDDTLMDILSGLTQYQNGKSNEQIQSCTQKEHCITKIRTLPKQLFQEEELCFDYKKFLPIQEKESKKKRKTQKNKQKDAKKEAKANFMKVNLLRRKYSDFESQGQTDYFYQDN